MKEHGFGLVEVLVAMLVLAVGILAMTNLQTVSLQSVSGSHQRSQAVAFANDVLDRIRVNSEGAMNGGYDLDGLIVPAPPTNCRGIGVQCSSAQIAVADLSEWTNLLDESLPDGKAWISRAGNSFEVRVGWNGDRVDVAGEDCEPPTLLSCVTFTADI